MHTMRGWVRVEGGEGGGVAVGFRESCAVLSLQAAVRGDNCDKELNPFLWVQSFGMVGTGPALAPHSCSRSAPGRARMGLWWRDERSESSTLTRCTCTPEGG